MTISVILLAFAMRSLPVGTAYAVWTGIGATGAALIGIFYLGEPRDALRLACLALILAAIIGLKVSSPSI
jgi:quaternary ammonium compound-resistance protein SugE